MTDRASPGAPAPDFTLAADGGRELTLSSLRGRKVVLYFYPRDNTSGCTKEAEAFRDAFADFEAANAAIVGVSPDSVKSHDRFKEKLGLPFVLVSDPDKVACRAYGVWVEKSMYGRKYMGVERATFLIDEAGVIREVWRKVKVKGHADAVLAAARALDGG